MPGNGNVLTGAGWWQNIDPRKMEAEPDEAPEWAVPQNGRWTKPKHWQWSPKDWCYRCTMCNKLSKNEGHDVESDMLIPKRSGTGGSSQKQSVW